MLKRVHHINFVVKDLAEAVGRYQSMFGLDHVEYLDHPHRNVQTARFRVGETWVVLLQPLDNDSPPGKHLQQHGEGFFLVSYEVDDITAAMTTVEEGGGRMEDKTARQGILDWQVADLDTYSTFGARIQLVKEKE